MGAIYVTRLTRLPLLAADESPVGRIADVVLGAPYRDAPPRVIGFVATVQRRRIFVNAGRVAEVNGDGVRLRSGTIDLRHFEPRTGELLADGDLLGRRFGAEQVNDLGIVESRNQTWRWEVSTVSLRGFGPRRRRNARLVAWRDVAEHFEVGAIGQEVSAMRDLHPVEMATALRKLPLERRRALADAMDDARLADLLEELTDEEQLALVEDLDHQRFADVLSEMELDDAADLLGELPGGLRIELLELMPDEPAGAIRRLLLYDEHTAGALMTPEAVIMAPDMTVAEALARIRESETHATLAAQVFVTDMPTQTPTGRYLGVVGFQRLLREPPGMGIGACVDESFPKLAPHVPEAEVARLCLAYELMALPIVDDTERLLGVVTVDDVLDSAMPHHWRGPVS